mmetsp:Transcript_49834/g.112171  ORF Transcript_49834/g.112171 Transcript_49834/m.112171 type:complete len:271 (-) Transcript_49834:30-842(-)
MQWPTQGSTLVVYNRLTTFVVLALSALFPSARAATTESPLGSCGTYSSDDCKIKDMGSCGNACCSMEFAADASPAEVAASLKSYLVEGGMDGLFQLKGEKDLTAYPVAWTWIAQGSHTTYRERYIDTLDFNVRPDGNGATIVRAFSISDVAGALGDMGQNHRTLSIVSKDLKWESPVVKFGCGDELPVSLMASGGDNLVNLTEPAPVVENKQDSTQGSAMGIAIGVLVMLALLMAVPFAWVKTQSWREGPLDEKQVQSMLCNDGYAPLIV